MAPYYVAPFGPKLSYTSHTYLTHIPHTHTHTPHTHKVGKRLVVLFSNYTTFAMGMKTSHDAGATWSATRWVDSVAGEANHSAVQPGTGVQIAGGPHAG